MDRARTMRPRRRVPATGARSYRAPRRASIWVSGRCDRRRARRAEWCLTRRSSRAREPGCYGSASRWRSATPSTKRARWRRQMPNFRRLIRWCGCGCAQIDRAAAAAREYQKRVSAARAACNRAWGAGFALPEPSVTPRQAARPRAAHRQNHGRALAAGDSTTNGKSAGKSDARTARTRTLPMETLVLPPRTRRELRSPRSGSGGVGQRVRSGNGQGSSQAA